MVQRAVVILGLLRRLAMLLLGGWRVLLGCSTNGDDIFGYAALGDGVLMHSSSRGQLPWPVVLLAALIEMNELLVPHQKIADVHVSICQPRTGVQQRLSWEAKDGERRLGRAKS
jgi:hypothetical protein